MIPAFVITGYLGSGKTSLILNSAREHFKGKKVAVVVNEFGEVGVDGKILEGVYSSVLELEEGCICCKLSAEFEKGVREIISEYNPEVLLVETSGAAEPFPIVFSLKTLGLFVDGVICVIDSKNFPRYKDEETAKYQLAASNIVVLNKADLVSEEELKKREEEIREIKEKYRIVNLFASEEKKNLYRIYRAVYGKVPPEAFRGYELNLTSPPHIHAHEEKQTEVIRFEGEVEEEELLGLLRSLPDDVIRAKGVVKIKGYPYPVFIHYVFGDYDYGLPAEGYEGDFFIVLIRDAGPKKVHR